MRIGPLRMLDRKWLEVTWPEEVLFVSMFCVCATGSCAISAQVGPFSPEVTKSRDRKRPCPALLFFPYIFFCTFFPYFFSRTFFLVLFSPVIFSRTFSKVATFQIQRFKISVSCFSSTCRYNTVRVPCGISIQTSPVGLSLDGWGACMRDLKGPKINLFNPKEDWNVL